MPPESLHRRQQNEEERRRTLAPHIWIYKNDVMWYTGQPTQQEYQVLWETVSDYIQLYQEPEHRQWPVMEQTI